MTGDKKYARRAENEMLEVSPFADWNPSHFLDVGEMVMALAIGFDWLYDYLQSIAVYEDVPDKTKAVIEKCLETNPKVLNAYGPDGGYPEGFHYWGYGTHFQVMLLAAFKSAFGYDKGLSKTPGLMESAYFMEYVGQ